LSHLYHHGKHQRLAKLVWVLTANYLCSLNKNGGEIKKVLKLGMTREAITHTGIAFQHGKIILFIVISLETKLGELSY